MTSPSPRPLRGVLDVPGDKSTTHRALLFGAFAEGTTRVRGALRAADTESTLAAVRALGARATDNDDRIEIEGVAQAVSPRAALACGNSATTARLLLGLLAGRVGRWRLDGDDSLRRRPMDRVCAPLRRAGARLDADCLPIGIEGASLRGLRHEVLVPSAQVKSALLLTGLVADGPTTVVQHAATRDHTERLLPRFGAVIDVAADRVTVEPGALRAADVDVPGDPSSAAFLVVAALLVPGSEVLIRDVGLWPRRTGFLRCLERAGATIVLTTRRRRRPDVELGATALTEGAAEDPRGDVWVRSAELDAFDVAPEDVPDLVDEIPVLAVAAARARGTSRFAGLAELRVKESDRIAGIAGLVSALGARVEERGDELRITGVAEFAPPPTRASDDHRMAMAAAVAAVATPGAPAVDTRAAAISYPGFERALASLRDGDADASR